MKRCTMVLAGMLALSLWIDVVAAQPPDGPDRQRGERRRSSRGPEDQGFGGPPGPRGGPEGRGPGGGFIPPLMAALDADKDGEISAKEIEGAVKALKKLDKNEDGRLTREELRPPLGGPGGFGPMGPGEPGRGRGPNEQGRGRGGPGEPGRMGGFGRGGPGGRGGGDFAQRLMGLDRDDDGKVAKDKAPPWMQERMFERADANEDGFIDEKEAEKMAQEFQRGGGPPRGAGRGQGGPGGRPPGDAGPRRPDEE